MKTLESLDVHLKNRAAELEELKAQGKKIIGYFILDEESGGRLQLGRHPVESADPLQVNGQQWVYTEESARTGAEDSRTYSGGGLVRQ